MDNYRGRKATRTTAGCRVPAMSQMPLRSWCLRGRRRSSFDGPNRRPKAYGGSGLAVGPVDDVIRGVIRGVVLGVLRGWLDARQGHSDVVPSTLHSCPPHQ